MDHGQAVQRRGVTCRPTCTRVAHPRTMVGSCPDPKAVSHLFYESRSPTDAKIISKLRPMPPNGITIKFWVILYVEFYYNPVQKHAPLTLTLVNNENRCTFFFTLVLSSLQKKLIVLD